MTSLAEPDATTVAGISVRIGEFWTARQRAAHRLHEISYRACFKPQLPRYFIDRFTRPGEVVLDPFMGRGTTLLEAAFAGRIPWGFDANPLCARLIRPRLDPPTIEEIAARLDSLDLSRGGNGWRDDLLVFFHPRTLAEICALRDYLAARLTAGTLDNVDAWIQMVALNRLTGHSPGFFSVYTLPPNQAVSIESQRKINQRLGQGPPRRDVAALIGRKTERLLASLSTEEVTTLHAVGNRSKVGTRDARHLPELREESVQLVVTSPPFLDTVDYVADNWMRNWFCALGEHPRALSIIRDLPEWTTVMTEAFAEIRRVLVPGGHVAFEVGEVRGGRIRLEEAAAAAGVAAGLEPREILINDQNFTKTSHCWGIANNQKGTNSNRIVVFQKPVDA